MIKIAFTGHRPNKLGGYDWNTEKNKKIIKKLKQTIINKINENKYNEKDFYFITGGALGIDQMAFDIISEYKKIANSINIITEIAVPFKNQSNKWFNKIDINRYNRQLENANKVTYVDTLERYDKTSTKQGEYNYKKLQIRNEYMVDNCDILVVVWDGSKSGTKNCVDYATKIEKEIIRINPSKL